MKSAAISLGVAAVLLLVTGCGEGGGSVVSDALASGTLSASVVGLRVQQPAGTPGWLGKIQFQVTVTNGTADDVYLVNGSRMPYFDATASPSKLVLRWDMAMWREDISTWPIGYGPPKTLKLESGSTHSWTVWVPNPVRPSNHYNVWWDETTTPPTMISTQQKVTLLDPITVEAVIGYGLTEFVPDLTGNPRRQFDEWRLQLHATPTVLDEQP